MEYFKKKTNYILNNFVSLTIYLMTFFVFYYFKKQSIILENNYLLLLLFYIVSYIIGTILSNKFRLTLQHKTDQIIRKIFISLILMLGSISILLLAFDIGNISRHIVIGSILTASIFESVYYIQISEYVKRINISEKAKLSYKYLLADGIVLGAVSYFLIMKNINFEHLNEKHFTLLAGIFVSWVLAAGSTHKFNPIERAVNKWNGFGLQLKFYLLIISFVSFGLFLLRVSPVNLGYFLEALFTYIIISFLLFTILFAEKIKNRSDEVTAIFLKAFEMKGPAIPSFVRGQFTKYAFKNADTGESRLKQSLKFDYLKDYQKVFDFLDRKIELKLFSVYKSLIFRSADTYNISVLPDESHQLIINLHPLNDIRSINNYLKDVNKKLYMGGVFVASLIPNKNRYGRFLSKYPFLIANFYALVDFIWKRMFPKLPVTRKIYFTLSNGKDRAISLAEGLGRLVYNGFEILDLTEINGIVYLAVVKSKGATYSEEPHYSIVFKMKRVGHNGKIIYVYKFRTMHPYSEFIQDLVHKHNHLDEGGKFKDDFRIPIWGSFFRKLWLDELPMIINLFKGDIKLVGVRPISSHYLSLYTPEYQIQRKKFKPGLIPPFYADMPKTIEEIEHSERKYLEAFSQNPVKTDFVYLLRILKNILIRRKRSA